MKKIFLFLCLSTLCVSIGCEDEPENRECFLFQQNAAWTVETLKSTYTIQFPATYTGTGFFGNDNFIFHKYRSDNAVTFYWSLCGFAWCEEYGNAPLATPFPNNISFNDDVKEHFLSNSLTDSSMLCF